MIAIIIEAAALALALAVIVQRERVLRRRLRRMETRFRIHARMSRPYRHVHVTPAALSPVHPVWQLSPTTVEQPAGLARPLAGSGG